MTPSPRAVLLGAFLLLPVPGAAATQDSWGNVERIVAVGDVHGDLAQLLTVLRDAGLVDGKGRWVGGRAHLVQTGDRVDRGPDSRKVMDLFMRLEKEARKKKGMVHPLIGNHEAMNVLGDLRYTTPEEYASFTTPDSGRVRAALIERLTEERRQQEKPPPTPEETAQWEKDYPLGFVEHRLAYGREGRYGSWIRRQNVVIKIGDTLFLHGGVAPKYADFTLTDLNERVRQELREGDAQLALLTSDPDGPLWYRGLAQDDPALQEHVLNVLGRHGCRRIVIGHTPTDGLVMPRFGGRVVQIDVGLSRVFGGPPAALVIESGRAYALHRGRKVALPEDPGADVLRYVREIAALEPASAPIAKLMESVAASLKAVPASP
jgi:hypothetical protein